MKSRHLLSFLAALLISSSSAYAQDVAPQPCDAAYWKTMSSRAWMEAEREIMQNQNLIYKPDSVLEYTCFDSLVDHTAKHAGPIFSHTTYFGNPPIIDPHSDFGLKMGLQNAVALALQPFNDQNFAHSFLGGRADFIDINPSNHEFDGKTRLGTYGCGNMSAVWRASKCMNFIHSDDFDGGSGSQTADGFYPFEEIQAHGGGDNVAGYKDAIQEARGLPTNCGGPDSAMGDWASNISDIENHLNTSFRNPLKTVFTEVYKKIKPGECKDAIPTGVMVYSSDQPDGYLGGVCSNPGCTYSAGSSSQVGQCS